MELKHKSKCKCKTPELNSFSYCIHIQRTHPLFFGNRRLAKGRIRQRPTRRRTNETHGPGVMAIDSDSDYASSDVESEVDETEFTCENVRVLDFD